MKRWIAPLWLALLLAGVTARPTLGALDVALSVSPADGVVGRPMEVLLRTFAPIPAGDIPLPTPSLPYPDASGLWNVLYPITDYPFDVVARTASGASIAITLTRDPSDGSLWRGSFTPTRSGEWTIVVRNFEAGAPGASTQVSVADAEVVPIGALIGVAAVLVGIFVGVLLGRGLRRSPAEPGPVG